MNKLEQFKRTLAALGLMAVCSALILFLPTMTSDPDAKAPGIAGQHGKPAAENRDSSEKQA